MTLLDQQPGGDLSQASKFLLFLISYPDVAQGQNMHTDFANELASRNLDVRVVAPTFTGRTRYAREGLVDVLRVRSGPLFKTNLITKGLNTSLLPFRFDKAIRRHLGGWRADWIVSPTPPITLAPPIRRLKRLWGAKFYLILRDIFPQNALDLGFMPQGIIYSYFRRQEKATYASADLIGCMSPGNQSYLLQHNPELDQDRVKLLPNWTSSQETGLSTGPGNTPTASRAAARAQWGIAADSLLCVFGGNLGKPQRVDFILEAATRLRSSTDIHFLIVGGGTEASWLGEEINKRRLTNVRLIRRLPRQDYDSLLTAADVGLITLHENFTIPNIPSRLLGYWSAGLPVLAATDTCTDLNASFLDRHGAGRWVPMGDLNGFVEAIQWFKSNRTKAVEMGRLGFRAVHEEYSTPRIIDKFLAQIHTNQAARRRAVGS